MDTKIGSYALAIGSIGYSRFTTTYFQKTPLAASNDYTSFESCLFSAIFYFFFIF